MKKEDLIKAIGLADDKYVLEAQNPTRTKKKRRIFTSIAAACITLVLVNLWLFLPIKQPTPYIAAFAGSDYYPIIERLYLNTEAKKYELPYGNNFEKLLYTLKSDDKPTNPGLVTDSLEDFDFNQTYMETTDNQNEGVIEADRIKRSDRYIYYVQMDQLMIYTAEGGEYELVGQTQLISEHTEIFLSLDCKYITAITQGYSKTSVCVFDVSDPKNIMQVSKIIINSTYFEARYLGNQLIIATRSNINFAKKEYSDPSTFVPMLEYNGKTQLISMDDIHITSYEYSDFRNYTALYVLDPLTLEPQSSFALLGGSNTVYFSKDNVFMVANYDKDGTDTCEISCISYTSGELEFKCALEAIGHVDDRRWMDEQDGVLRVFSNTQSNNSDNTALSVFDLKKEKTVTVLKNFAPEGESLRSVRFDGDKAYVCTAIVQKHRVIDPVFFFDLSDYKNISYTDTGTIPGYSHALINYKDGYLLGVGFIDRKLKFEVYKEENGKVVSTSKIESGNPDIPSDYKAYFIDRERNLFGYDMGSTKLFSSYHLFEIKDGVLYEMIIDYEPLKKRPERTRALYIDDCLYIFNDAGVYVHSFEDN